MRHAIFTESEHRRLVDKLYRWTDWAKRSLRPFHEHQRDMHKVYEAKPLSKTRDTPYMGAPNVVIPTVAIETDSLTAKETSAYFQTEPVWTKKGLTQNQTGIEDLREAQETFLNYVGLSPDQMDLQAVYNTLLAEKNELGMAVLKMAWEVHLEKQVNDITGEVTEIETHRGPRVYHVPTENMLFHPTEMRHEDETEILGEILPMGRETLLKRKRERTYYAGAVDDMLLSPDNHSNTPSQRDEQSAANVHVSPDDEFASKWTPIEYWMEWHIPEGGCESVDDEAYKINGSFDGAPRLVVPEGDYHLIVTFHPTSMKILRAVFNFYPQNLTAYVFWYLARRKGTAVGKGYAEMLEEVQRISSDAKNQRMANGALANCRIWAGKPALANQVRTMYPNAFWPCNNPQTDILAINMADVYPSAFEEENSNWELTSRITGNPAAQQGLGAGSVSKTTGQYGTMSSLAMIQQGNTRGDIRVFDSKYFHTIVGIKAQLWYMHFGVPEKLLDRFGDLGKTIEESFKQENLDKLLIPTMAATASNNVEVDRQNSQLVFSMLQGFAKEATTMLIAAGNPMSPAPISEYTWNMLAGLTRQARFVTKAFNNDDTNRLVPDLPAGGSFTAFRQLTAPPPPPQLPGGEGAPPAPGGPEGAGPVSPGGPGAPGGGGVPPVTGTNQPPPLPVGPA